MSRNNEIIAVRISRRSIALYIASILVFAVVWFLLTGTIAGGGAFVWVFRLAPLLSLYQPLFRLYWGLTVNTVEGKFTYRRLFHPTEEFFRQDITEVKRETVSANGAAEEILTIRTAKLSISLRCSDPGINGFLGAVSFTNVMELAEYLGV